MWDFVTNLVTRIKLQFTARTSAFDDILNELKVETQQILDNAKRTRDANGTPANTGSV
jgi:hypothetical protein